MIRKRYFCTLFDSNYLLRGLALYRSLEKWCPNFTLYVLCMDDKCHQILSDLKLENIILISLEDFEDKALLSVKPTRTKAEYCWTITPSLPLYVLKLNSEIDLISYVDADCYFFSSPEPMFQELGGKDVFIIPHRYSLQYQDLEKTSGKFNVGVLSFKNNLRAIEVLDWWRERCIEWCFHRYEDGKMGDQLYLDVWPEKFPQVHVLKHIGACVAPWNIHSYIVTNKNGVHVDDKPLIFYHFHALRIYSDLNYLAAVNYDFQDIIYSEIYDPYVNEIRLARLEVKRKWPEFESGIETVEQTQRYKKSYPRKIKFSQKLMKKAFFLIRQRIDQVNRYMLRKTSKTGDAICPVCDSKNSFSFTSVSDDRFGYPGKFIVYSCPSCHHRFLQVSFTNEEITRLYSDYYPRSQINIQDVKAVPELNGMNDWWAGNERAIHNVPKAVRVLDIGCGYGESLLYHKKRGCEVYGSETDENALKSVEHLSLPIKVGPFRYEDYPQNFFDYITMDQVIEHLSDPKDMIDKIKSLLKPGGKFIFSTPNGTGIGSIFFRKKWIHWHAPYHLHYFSRKSLRELVKNTDMEIEEVKQVTCAEWLNYQFRHLVDFPNENEASPFFAPHSPLAKPRQFFGKAAIIYIIQKLNKWKINELITRFFDLIGLGDNWIVVVVRTK